MTILPFICLAIGIALGLIIKIKTFPDISDKVMTIALVFLMLTIEIGHVLSSFTSGAVGLIIFF